VGQAIEQAFKGEAQDIEGGLITVPGQQGHQVVIFQTRPQL
jgi:formylmethanofuran dehydrogenase subunit C